MTAEQMTEMLASEQLAEQIMAALIIGLILNGICMIVCPIIAGWKRRSVAGWFFGGLFLSVIGLIILICIPSLDRGRRRRDDDDYDEDDD